MRFSDTFTSARDEILIENSIVITGFKTAYMDVTENTVCAERIFPSKTYPKILRNIDVLVTKVSNEYMMPNKYLCCLIDWTSLLQKNVTFYTFNIKVLSCQVTYLLAKEISLANGFSQVYILMTCIPDTISFINLTLSSVRNAVLNLKTEVLFPKNTKNNNKYIKNGG